MDIMKQMSDDKMNGVVLESIVKEIKVGFYTSDEQKVKKLIEYLEYALQRSHRVEILDEYDFQNLCFIYSMSDELKMTKDNIRAKRNLETRLYDFTKRFK